MVLRGAIAGAVVLAAISADALFLKKTLEGNQNFIFDYSRHGADWLSGMCASVARQSPIDVMPPQPTGNVGADSAGEEGSPEDPPLSFSYLPIQSPFKLENNGHTLVADFQGYGYGGVT